MPYRFIVATLIFLLSIGAAVQAGYAQQVSSVVISGAGLNDGYLNAWGLCDSEGQLYRRSNGRGAQSVMRVARDGSTVIFAAPENGSPLLVAPDSHGVVLLSVSEPPSQTAPRHIYRFDKQGNLVSHHQVFLDFLPYNVAVTSSGMLVVVGYRTRNQAKNPAGAVLDADGQVVRLLEFPPAVMKEGEWAREWAASVMMGSDAVAYFIPHSQTGPIYSIAESGRIDIVQVPPVGKIFVKWLFGNGVAVEEEYIPPGEKSPRGILFHVYDLTTGKKIGSKSLPHAMGGNTACYLGDEISWLAATPGSQELRLITVKLE